MQGAGAARHSRCYSLTLPSLRVLRGLNFAVFARKKIPRKNRKTFIKAAKRNVQMWQNHIQKKYPKFACQDTGKTFNFFMLNTNDFGKNNRLD